MKDKTEKNLVFAIKDPWGNYSILYFENDFNSSLNFQSEYNSKILLKDCVEEYLTDNEKIALTPELFNKNIEILIKKDMTNKFYCCFLRNKKYKKNIYSSHIRYKKYYEKLAKKYKVDIIEEVSIYG